MIHIALGLLAGYGLICLLLYGLQENMIFPGQTLPADYAFAGGEEVWMKHGAARLHGLFFQAESPRGAVLYFHGNGGNLADWGEVAPGFLSRGYHLLMVDYRGYGKSTGARTEAALLADALVAYDSLQARVGPDLPVVAFGRSLGSGPASYVAAHRPVDRLLLETPYRSLAAVAQARFPWLPVRWLIRYSFQAETYLVAVKAPIFLVHGSSDQTIPVSHSQYLSQQLPEDQVHYLEIPGGHHNDLATFAVYQRWLDQALSAPSSSQF